MTGPLTNAERADNLRGVLGGMVFPQRGNEFTIGRHGCRERLLWTIGAAEQGMHTPQVTAEFLTDSVEHCIHRESVLHWNRCGTETFGWFDHQSVLYGHNGGAFRVAAGIPRAGVRSGPGRGQRGHWRRQGAAFAPGQFGVACCLELATSERITLR